MNGYGNALDYVQQQPNQPDASSVLRLFTQLMRRNPSLATNLRAGSSATDPYASMIQSMRHDYPFIANIPFSVSRGTGPYESEVYEPWVKDSPTPGQFHIELRHFLDQPRSQEDIRRLLTGEMFHYLGNVDPRTSQQVNPQWYALKQKVWETMPQHDRQNAHDRWMEEQAAQLPNERRSFDRFLQESYLDQYIGGVMFPLSDPRWSEWQQRAQSLPRVAPQQSTVIERMRQLLTTRQ